MRNKSLTPLLHLMQFADSALPVGGFSFSNTLESAIDTGLVHNYHTLDEFVSTLLHLSATTDGIAALNAYRATTQEDYQRIVYCDKQLFSRKTNTELRVMSQRMGRKMAELSAEITHHRLLTRLAEDIVATRTAGCYAVVQGVAFAACGIGERELFAAICYGTATMTLNAAVRSMRITHRQTQQILFSLAQQVDELYNEVVELDISEMHSFSPQVDILSSLHEKGAKRLFMN